MGIEFELKYRATVEIQQAIRAEIPGQERLFSMQTTYYDTPDGALSARRYTLRRRMENEISVCTLKAPAGDARGEWEVNCDRIEDAIHMLCKLGAPEDLAALTAEGVIPICGARFHRIARTVELPECTVELALDEGVLTGGGKELPLCEVEVELKSGMKAVCVAFAEKLAEVYGLTPEPKSKFRRALDLYRGE